MKKTLSKKMMIMGSVGTIISSGTLAGIVVVATASSTQHVDSLASISLYDETLNDFVYSSILKPKKINTTLHKNYLKLKTDGKNLDNVIISSGGKHIHKLKGNPIKIEHDSLMDAINQNPKFANKPKSVKMNEFDKEFAKKLLQANKDLRDWITREGGAVSNQFDIELTPKKGHFEAILYLSVPEHLSDFANEFMTDINTSDQVDAILKANPEKITDIRLLGAVAFASPQALQSYYWLTTGTTPALLNSFPIPTTPLDNKVVGTHDSQAMATKYGYVGNTNTDGQYFTYKKKRYIVIMSPIINEEKATIDILFDFYSGGKYIDVNNEYRAVDSGFSSHTTRTISLNALPASTDGASAKFSTSEQRRIIREAFDPNSNTGGKIISVFNTTHMLFGLIKGALPSLSRYADAMNDTIPQLKTADFSEKNVDLILDTIKKSPILDLTTLLEVFDKLDPNDLNPAKLKSASTALLRELYLVFGTQSVLEELSHNIQLKK